MEKEKIKNFLNQPLVIINIGLRQFAEKPETAKC